MMILRSPILLLVAALASPAFAQPDDDMEGYARTGSVYHRIDMDGGTPAACEALCDRSGQCQSWTWAMAGLYGPDTQCSLLSGAPTPTARPGHITGLSPALRARIDRANERPLSTLEQAALAATEPRRYR